MVVSIVGQRGRWAVADAVICLLIVLIVDLLYRKVVPLTRRWALVIPGPLPAILYLASVLTGLLLAIFLLVLITKGSPSMAWQECLRFLRSGSTTEALVYIFGTVFGISFLLELSRRIGPGRLVNWLIGRYRSPREEVRLFLFIDLTDSTPLAEELGSLKFSYLLRDFFDDLTEPVIE